MAGIDFILDTSVLVKALVPEPGSDRAAALLARAVGANGRLVAPAFSWTEVGSVLLKKVRTGEMDSKGAGDLWADVLGLGIEYLDGDSIREAAWRIASEYGLPSLYDAAFLATAEVLCAQGSGVEFWTADLDLVGALGSKAPAYVHVL